MMGHNTTHLTDEELLMQADGELSSRRAAEIRAHLKDCSSCRERAEALEGASADFAQAHLDDLSPSLPPAAYSRARLRARLAAMPGGARRSSWLDPEGPLAGRAWLYVCAAILVAAVSFQLIHQRVRPRDSQTIAAVYGYGPLVPDASLTPGAVHALTVGEVCKAGGPRENRPPLPLQMAVFHEYGMDGAPAQQYEVDHLITPALGGTDDIRNLWPESYSSQWNAHVKDELEDHLHDLVCQGKLDLPTAQRDIARDWISAYQKYFHTDKPLPRNSKLIADHDRGPDS
jgi:anti-sigma factor RsiW